MLIWLKAGGVWTGPTSVGAVVNADYLVKTANPTLSAERVVTDNSAAGAAVWDWSVAGQAKAKLYASGANKVLHSTGANAWAETSWTTDGANISGVGKVSVTGFFVTPADSGWEWWNGSFTAVGPWQVIHRRLDGVWSQALSIDPTTLNIGIGMAASYKLDVFGDIRANALLINGGGAYQAGCVYSDTNFGMIFRAKTSSPGMAHYGWYDSANNALMHILSNGNFIWYSAGNPDLVVSTNKYAGFSSLSLDNATNGGLIDFGKNGTLYGQMYAYPTEFAIKALGGAPMHLSAGGANAITIDPTSGNVGIWTNPNATHDCMPILEPIKIYGFALLIETV